MSELQVVVAHDNTAALARLAADATMAAVEAGGFPNIDRLPAHLTTPGASPDLLKAEILHLITDAMANAPRSLQVRIGPSELGHDCSRRIAYKLLGHPENEGDPNWKAQVGTWGHAGLEDVMMQANTREEVRSFGYTRWIVEATVSVGEILGQDITGHCDLFDRVTGTVVDWKFVGPTQLKKYKAKGPGRQYRSQAHLYGRGWTRRGQDVHRVAVFFLPRDGELRDAYLWSEPYDEQVALDALQRAEGIATVVGMLGPAAPAALPTADAFCSMCPYFKRGSTDPAVGCPGDPASQRQATPALTLT